MDPRNEEKTRRVKLSGGWYHLANNRLANIDMTVCHVKIIGALACHLGFLKYQLSVHELGKTLFEENLEPVHGLTFDSLHFYNTKHYMIVGLPSLKKRVAVLGWEWKYTSFLQLLSREVWKFRPKFKICTEQFHNKKWRIYSMEIFKKYPRMLVKYCKS